jgi:hypothetical protein
MRKLLKYMLPAMLFFVIIACDKEVKNERALAGVWEATEVTYLFYENNKEVRDCTVTNTGAMYLYDDAELGNQFRHSLSVYPKSFDEGNIWNGNEGEMRTFMGLNVRKHTSKKLELSDIVEDQDLNIMKNTIYYFERP